MLGHRYTQSEQISKKSTTLLVALVSQLLGIASLWSQVHEKNESEEYVFDKTVRENIYPNEHGISQLRIDLGPIPAQGTGRLVVIARNASNAIAKIGDSFTGCGCLAIKVSKPQLQPNEDAEIELTFKPEKEPVQLERVTTAFVFPKGTPDVGLQIAIRYQMEGMLAFNQRSASLQVDHGSKSKEFLFPLTISSPVSPDGLKVILNGALRSSKAAIVTRDNQPFVKLTVPLENTRKCIESGNLRVEDKDGTRFDEIECFVEKKLPMSVIPNRLRFRWNQTNSLWEGESMVQVSDSISQDKLMSDAAIRVVVGLGDRKLQTELKPIRRGLVRVFVQIPAGIALTDNSQLTWDVRVGGQAYEATTSIAFVRAIPD